MTQPKPQHKVNLCRHWRQGLITHLNPTCPFCDIDKLKDEIETLRTVEPMTAVADRYAHRMAMVLECVLMDRTSDRWWNEGMQLIGEYRSAMNAIHEKHSPTFMGEPVLPRDHITTGAPCWCNPETTYKDPDTGVSVIVHKEMQ